MGTQACETPGLWDSRAAGPQGYGNPKPVGFQELWNSRAVGPQGYGNPKPVGFQDPIHLSSWQGSRP